MVANLPECSPGNSMSCPFLAAATKEFKSISRDINQPVMVVDGEMRVVLVNNAARRMSGEAPSYHGRRCWELFVSSPSPCPMYPARCWIKEVLSTGLPLQKIVSLRAADGKLLHASFSASPLYDETRKVRQAAVLLRDATREQEYLQAGEAPGNRCIPGENTPEASITRALLDSIGEGILFLDPDFRIVNVNKRLLEIGNYRLEEVAGKYCYEVSHNFDRPCWTVSGKDHICPVKIALETGKSATAIHNHQAKKGRPLFIEVKAFPLLNRNGEIFQVIETHTDISEKKAIESRLLQAEKLESLGTLAGGIAHDLNNILTPILGISEMVLATAPADHPQRREFGEILTLASRAADLVRQILAFSRRQVIDKTWQDLNLIIENLRQMLNRVIREDIALETRLDRNLWQINADRTQIEQIIINLVVNARDAMPEGGALLIETRNVDRLDGICDTCGETFSGPFVLLQVRDQGTGIAPEIMRHIFEPFFTTKEQGTGMGLASSIGILHQHDGHVNVDSVPGVGSTFKIFLPRFASGPLVGPTRRKLGAGSNEICGSEVVLVVDDDEHVRGFLETVLSQYGYSVLTAENGRRALELFSRHRERIDLVLADVVMPGMGGSELMERIREKYPGMPALLMSGYSLDAVNRQLVLEKGIELMQKPLAVKDLMRRIRALLDPKSRSSCANGKKEVETWDGKI